MRKGQALPTRRCATVALMLVALLASLNALAQAGGPWPNRTVKFIVPFEAGGPVDLTARVIARNLNAPLGQPVVIENRPGAGMIIGLGLLAKAPPDGHTWAITSNGVAINPSVYKKLPYDTFADLAPVTLISTTPSVLVAHPSTLARTAADLVKLAKDRPGELMYSTSGVGSGNHLAAELFNSLAGVNTTHVPYKGSPSSIAAVVSGDVQFQFGNPIASIPLIRAGKLRGLGTTGARRVASMPELPPVAESGVPGYEANQWYGLFTAGGTSAPIVKQIQVEVARVLASAEVSKPLSAEGAEMIGNAPEQFAAFLKSEIAKWTKVVQRAGVTAEY